MDGAAAERGGLMLLDDNDGSNTADMFFTAKLRLVVERSFQVRNWATDVGRESCSVYRMLFELANYLTASLDIEEAKSEEAVKSEVSRLLTG